MKKTKDSDTTQLVSTKKELQTVAYKSVPSVFRKAYTQKKLDRRLLDRIYIPADRELVQGLVTEVGKNKKGEALYSIRKDAKITVKENSQLAVIAKEIRTQKSRIRWIPLLATIIFIAAAIITINLTRNKIARRIITDTCEVLFEAKTDIRSINVSFWHSTFDLKGLQIADKNSPMKNLVDIDSIVFSFDLLQLTRARFVANELSITGVDSGTDRAAPGYVSDRIKAKIARKKQAEQAVRDKFDATKIMQEIQEKTDASVDIVKNAVTGVFDKYNPETIITGCYNQMKSPQTAQTVQAKAGELVEKYKALPEEMNTKVQEVQALVERANRIDINAIQSDADKLREAIKLLLDSLEEAKALQSYSEQKVNGMKSDVNQAADLAKEVQSSITADINMIGNEISRLTVTVDDGKRFITETFDAVAYQYLGKYYPYVMQATEYLSKLKTSASRPKPEKKEKKEKQKAEGIKRAEGRNVYYKTDSTPKFWIKKAAGSGPMFSFDALDVTNDMDKTGRPSTANVSFTAAGIDHTAKLAVDTRAASKDALITAGYGCSKLPVKIPSDRFGGGPGVPSIDSSSQLDFSFKIFEDDGFSVGGKGKFTGLSIVPNAFEPDYAYKIYANTMDNIKEMSLGISGGYTLSKGLDLSVSSDVDRQFASALQKELMNQLDQIKDRATAEMSKKVNELTGGALGELNSFDDLKTKIYSYADMAASLENELQKKYDEAQKALAKAAEAAVKETAQKAEAELKNQAKNALKGLFQ